MNGQLKSKYGDAFIRGNNALYEDGDALDKTDQATKYKIISEGQSVGRVNAGRARKSYASLLEKKHPGKMTRLCVSSYSIPSPHATAQASPLSTNTDSRSFCGQKQQ
ncbi:hypothetical protein TREES_T100018439 [Tupaia chinensis]|uniref:Uncharacterized protein n=1 Tax=Tupaia chinensis TaxID=246437 RepID=L9KYU3_TUPCH|nr:hypothetical protein TREES_T100018439 [Tupaia chinensis]